ncbi:hypothetical protein QY049_03140 [Bradyrhizobium sp. WYCCWR 13022]|uniref:hypothetical protein n=1 Tax=unclassified Bradyrhizobium TaxID=2631580 RepID=UPI00263B7B4E|nr:hypothetical protein [Bradyrhizobium sp. WYCCWR 13022]MDN4982220.1 hypothetical protein [Bradyrhizobium sp. WYCCWR 13022]
MNRQKHRAQNTSSLASPPKLFMEEVSASHSETGHDELYLVMDGARVAYRGHPGTSEAGQWISLDPAIQVLNGAPEGMPIYSGGEIEVFPEPKSCTQ